jgi:hypothetical protein
MKKLPSLLFMLFLGIGAASAGTVTALGADFFGVNILAQPKPTTITLNFAGGPTRTISTSTSTSTFTGYTFNVPLTSMTISSPSGSAAAPDNLVVGKALPEPGTWMLLTAALGFLGLAKLIQRVRLVHRRPRPSYTQPVA